MKIFLLFITLTAIDATEAIKFGVKDLVDAGVGIGKTTINGVPDLIPSPEQFLDLGKQAIAGYPFEVASTAINKICSSAVSGNNIKPRSSPESSKLNFVLMKNNGERISVPILQPEKLFGHEKFDKKKPLTIFVTGWLSDINATNDALHVMTKAYVCRGTHNFVAIDTAQFVNTFYTWSAFNTEEVGTDIGRALATVLKFMPVDKIHLIGHSLGAHIVGAAGRTFHEMTGQLIPRITGLDPAKPCFNEGEVLTGLGRGDAAFVDVIHSNCGVLGRREPMGDIDFYPGGLTPLPPGCIDIVCAHSRAWEFYAESVYPGNEEHFRAKRCNSLTRVKSNKCPGNEIIMGFAATNTAKGNYFLDVNTNRPFGLNAVKRSTPQCNQSK